MILQCQENRLEQNPKENIERGEDRQKRKKLDEKETK